MENIDVILKEANRCLNCKTPLCSKEGCPIQTKIPDFIAKIKEKDFEGAYYILQENNIMSNICCRICPVENQCIGKCVRGIKGEPIQINKLEQFVNDWAEENNIVGAPAHRCPGGCGQPPLHNNTNIAIIGSGPAGIACAWELTKKGFNVTIFEKENKIGGVLMHGIPDFRLPKNIIDNLETKLQNWGIKIKTNIELGKDITIETLKKDGYNAIFLAIGAEIPMEYNINVGADEGQARRPAPTCLRTKNNRISKGL